MVLSNVKAIDAGVDLVEIVGYEASIAGGQPGILIKPEIHARKNSHLVKITQEALDRAACSGLRSRILTKSRYTIYPGRRRNEAGRSRTCIASGVNIVPC